MAVFYLLRESQAKPLTVLRKEAFLLMSVKIMTLVWENAPYSENKLIVLLALADWANDEGQSWPSMARLAAKARIDVRSARRIVRVLEKDQFVQIEEGGGRAKQNRYCIDVAKLQTRTQCPSLENGNADIGSTETRTLEAQTRTLRAETRTPVSSDPLVDPLEEPSLDPSEARTSSPNKKIGTMSEEEFLDQLESNPAYEGISVRQLNDKMKVWCAVNGKKPTRRRLVNWLNREDKPLLAPVRRYDPAYNPNSPDPVPTPPPPVVTADELARLGIKQ